MREAQMILIKKTCSKPVLLNVFSFIDGHESFVVKDFLLGSYERSFPAEKYKFVAQKSPLFRVYLYNWSKNTEYTVSQFIFFYLVCSHVYLKLLLFDSIYFSFSSL